MYKTTFLGVLEAEKLQKHKCTLFSETPCRYKEFGTRDKVLGSRNKVMGTALLLAERLLEISLKKSAHKY